MITSSVIIINYNTAHLTIQAVDAVLTFSECSTIEIIVVDNASENEDYESLKNGLKGKNKVHLYRSRINLGFGGGNMFGVQQAIGKYYVFLNSDAFLIENSIKVAEDFLDKNPDVSVVGARSIDQYGNSYKNFNYPLNLWQELFGDKISQTMSFNSFPSRKAHLTVPTKVGSVQGSFMVCRAADFDAVGGFDDNLFLYFEEIDLAHRIRKKLGKETYYLPQTTYMHLKGQSTSASYITKKELRISQFYVIRKNLGLIKYLIFYFTSFFKFLAKSPFSPKNRKYLALALRGVPLSESLKQKQTLQTNGQ